jgi:hypothetical protein
MYGAHSLHEVSGACTCPQSIPSRQKSTELHVSMNSSGCLCRLVCVWAVGMVFRMKFYFVWTLADANFTLAGFGFNGWEDKARHKARWDRHTNGWPLQIEFAGSTAEVMRVWNARTGTFLRRCAASIGWDMQNPLLFFQIMTPTWDGLSPCIMHALVDKMLMCVENARTGTFLCRCAA